MGNICLQSLTSGNVWGDKDKNDDQQCGWNVDNFMQVAKELVSSKINYENLQCFMELRLVLYFGIERRRYINLLKRMLSKTLLRMLLSSSS